MAFTISLSPHVTRFARAVLLGAPRRGKRLYVS